MPSTRGGSTSNSILSADSQTTSDLTAKSSQIRRRSGFARVPDEVWQDYRLTPSDVVAYCALSRLALHGNIARVSTREIAERAHMSQKQAAISVKRLVQFGHVKPSADNAPRKTGWYELVSPVFGAKQGKEDAIVSSPRGQRYVSMDHDRHGMPPREEVA